MPQDFLQHISRNDNDFRRQTQHRAFHWRATFAVILMLVPHWWETNITWTWKDCNGVRNFYPVATKVLSKDMGKTDTSLWLNYLNDWRFSLYSKLVRLYESADIVVSEVTRNQQEYMGPIPRCMYCDVIYIDVPGIDVTWIQVHMHAWATILRKGSQFRNNSNKCFLCQVFTKPLVSVEKV